MAALIGDFVPDLSRFHSIIQGSASIPQHQGQQLVSHNSPPSSSSAAAAAAAATYRSSSRNRPPSNLSAPRSQRPDVPAPAPVPSPAQPSTTSTPNTAAAAAAAAATTTTTTTHTPTSTATTIPSSSGVAGGVRPAQQGQKPEPKPRPRQGHGDAQPGQPGPRIISTLTSTSSGGAPAQFPSPPPSSSPIAEPGPSAANHGKPVPMASQVGDSSSSADGSSPGSSASGAATRPRQQQQQQQQQQQHQQIQHQHQHQHQQQPSPPSEPPAPAAASTAAAGPSSSQASPAHGSYLVASSALMFQRLPRRQTLRVRDLAHIESLVRAELMAEEGTTQTASSSVTGSNGHHNLDLLHDPPLHQVQYEISGMPIGDIIEMVAALLTKITATNDLQHGAVQRNVARQHQANQSADVGAGGSQPSPLSHSVLAFHGRNVPAITILSYLSRVHKYCPTTYEVFLSLLVYFDRMTERVNDLVMRSEADRRQSGSARPPPPHQSLTSSRSETPSLEASGSDLTDDDELGEAEGVEGVAGGNAEDEDHDMADTPAAGAGQGREGQGPPARAAGTEHAALSPPATYFVVDSYNIHRLIIAGVTCASKYFSDVFYTNSRYAKVGGLPLTELNHLEIQFLVLNDFRLAVPVEDLEMYATMLVEFYAREVVAPRTRRPTAE